MNGYGKWKWDEEGYVLKSRNPLKGMRPITSGTYGQYNQGTNKGRENDEEDG